MGIVIEEYGNLLNEKERDKYSLWVSEMEAARGKEIDLNPNLKEKINQYYYEGISKFMYETLEAKRKLINNNKTKNAVIIALVAFGISIILLNMPRSGFNSLFFNIGWIVAVFFLISSIGIKLGFLGVHYKYSNSFKNPLRYYIFSDESKKIEHREDVKNRIERIIQEDNVNSVDFNGMTLLDNAKYREGLIKENSEIIRFSEEITELLKSKGAKSYEDLSVLVHCEKCGTVRSLIIDTCIDCENKSYVEISSLLPNT